MDLTVASAFLPQVVVDFELNTQQFALAGWVVTMYLAAYAVSMTFAGRLSDLYGRRAAYLVCLAIFIVGSMLVALTRTTGLVALVFAGMAGHQPRDSGAGRRRDGACLDGARRRSVSARATRDAARHHRRGRYGGLGGRPSVRRHHDSPVHRLALDLLAQHADRLAGVCACAGARCAMCRTNGVRANSICIGAVLIGAALAAFNIAAGRQRGVGATLAVCRTDHAAYQGPLLIASIAAVRRVHRVGTAHGTTAARSASVQATDIQPEPRW